MDKLITDGLAEIGLELRKLRGMKLFLQGFKCAQEVKHLFFLACNN